MARIVFTWELGGGYGHLLRMLPLALELEKRGHEVILLLRNLERVEQLFGQYNFSIYQAPIWQASSVGLPAVTSYTDILLRHGYFNVDGLTGLVKSWNNCFNLLKPDLLIFDFSPTAMLASFGSDIPRVVYGNGFEIPPDKTPLPSMYWWKNVPEKKLIDHEQKVLNTVNQVQEKLMRPTLSMLSQLFSVNELFLATFKELDHYPERLDQDYCGIPLYISANTSCHWPLSTGKKIFVYLNQDYQGLKDLIRALDSMDCSVLIHSPGLSNTSILKLQSSRINFSSQAVNIDSVCKECDLTICHSGTGTGTSTLLAGKPLLLIPNQLEQYIAAKRIAEFGACLFVEPKQNKVNFKNLLKTLLGNSSYSIAAKTFAEKYSRFDPQKKVEDLAVRCEQLFN